MHIVEVTVTRLFLICCPSLQTSAGVANHCLVALLQSLRYQYGTDTADVIMREVEVCDKFNDSREWKMD